MNVEACYRGATRNVWDGQIFYINSVADLGRPATGAGTASNTPRNRGPVKFRQQRDPEG